MVSKCIDYEDYERAEKCAWYPRAYNSMVEGRDIWPFNGEWLRNRSHYMRELVDTKFEQCTEFRQHLMNTGNAL